MSRTRAPCAPRARATSSRISGTRVILFSFSTKCEFPIRKRAMPLGTAREIRSAVLPSALLRSRRGGHVGRHELRQLRASLRARLLERAGESGILDRLRHRALIHALVAGDVRRLAVQVDLG